MYVVYNKDKGFLSERKGVVCSDYEYELDEYTVTFPTLENAQEHCEMGEVVLKMEFHTYA